MSFVGIDPPRARDLAARCRVVAADADDVGHEGGAAAVDAVLGCPPLPLLIELSQELEALAATLVTRADLADQLRLDPSIFAGWGLVARTAADSRRSEGELVASLLDDDGATPADARLAARILLTSLEGDDLTVDDLLTVIADPDADPLDVWAAGLVLTDPAIRTALTSLAAGEQLDPAAAAAAPFGRAQLEVLATGGRPALELAVAALPDPPGAIRGGSTPSSDSSFVSTVLDALGPVVPPLPSVPDELVTLWDHHGPVWGTDDPSRSAGDLLRNWILTRPFEVVPGFGTVLFLSRYGTVGIDAGPVSVGYSGAGGEERAGVGVAPLDLPTSLGELLVRVESVTDVGVSWTPSAVAPTTGTIVSVGANAGPIGQGGGVAVDEDGRAWPYVSIGEPGVDTDIRHWTWVTVPWPWVGRGGRGVRPVGGSEPARDGGDDERRPSVGN